MRIARCLAALLILAAVLLALPAGAAEEVKSGAGPVWVIDLADTINPGTAEYLRDGLERAAAADAVCVIIQIDTPGGLVDSMRDMVRGILAAPLPVVVYVAPQGARAASAGAFIMLSAGVAAMAPATNVGAAHPVGAGGKEIEGSMGDKVVADLVALAESLAKRRGRDPALARSMVVDSASYDAGQAKEKGLADLVAPDLGTLITALEGRVVETGAGKRLIQAKGRTIHFHQPDTRQEILSLLANPNIAYILMMIGLVGLYFELSNPGAIFPGVIGGLSLILALFAMSTLPVSYTGLALIGLAVVLFIAEIKITSGGLLTLGGAASLVLGSIMLFDSDDSLLRVSLSVLIPTVIGVTGFFVGVTYLAARAQLGRQKTGGEGLVGRTGVVTQGGKVRIWGELWNARSPEMLVPGEEVVVKKVEGLLLYVEPKSTGE